MPAPPRTLYIIDAFAQFFRAYYAIRSGMSSPVTGEPTNMTFGFVGMLLKMMRAHAPDYLVVAIDTDPGKGVQSVREAVFPEYKANREKAPDDFSPQVERCLALLAQMGITVIGAPGYEADDVIATLVHRMEGEHPDLAIRIISRDKDLSQLIRSGVELYDVHTEESVTPARIFKTEGVQPCHVGDILALMGDTVDNIPGVPGIGPKTAAKLIMEYGDLDTLLANCGQVKGKKGESIDASRDQIALSRELVALHMELPLDFDLEEAAFDPSRLPVEDMLASFRELNFNQHQDSLKALAGQEPEEHGTVVPIEDEEPPAGSLFAGSTEPTAVTLTAAGDYECVVTRAGLEAVAEAVRGAGCCAVDTETDGLSIISANLCGISIAIEVGAAWYIPTRSPDPEVHLDTETVIEILRPVLEDPGITKIGQNLKFDINILRQHGIELAGPLHDTMIASSLVDSTRSSHAMNVLALALLGHTCIPITDLIGTGKNQRTFDTVPLDVASIYAAEDADITLRLWQVLEPRLADASLVDLFDETEMPLVEVLAAMEHAGIRVDAGELEQQRTKLAVQIDDLREQIEQAAPHPFNPDSPKQLAAALFNAPGDDPPGLGLPVQKRGKSGPSTSRAVLEKLDRMPSVDTPLPSLQLEYRQLSKLVNTYLVSLPGYIEPSTGRIHASFHQAGTSTGRLSSSDPNLQNIPIRSDVGREIRRAFIAEEGCMLVTADYSQIELRMLAHLSGDVALSQAFHDGADIHRAVAAETFGIPAEEVSGPQRESAKAINFGIIYGLTPWGLARQLDIGDEEAARFIDDYKARFPGIESFMDDCVAQAMDKGYVETMLGRRREIIEVQARDHQQASLGKRLAINTVVQGSAADLIKRAMISLHRELPGRFPGARMLLQIHDELVFEVSEDHVTDLQAFVVEGMEHAMDLNVPLVVEAVCARSWIDAK